MPIIFITSVYIAEEARFARRAEARFEEAGRPARGHKVGARRGEARGWCEAGTSW